MHGLFSHACNNQRSANHARRPNRFRLCICNGSASLPPSTPPLFRPFRPLRLRRFTVRSNWRWLCSTCPGYLFDALTPLRAMLSLSLTGCLHVVSHCPMTDVNWYVDRPQTTMLFTTIFLIIREYSTPYDFSDTSHVLPAVLFL